MDRYYFNGQRIISPSERLGNKGFRDGKKYWIKMYTDKASFTHELEILNAISSNNGVAKMIESGIVDIVSDNGNSTTYHAIKETYIGDKNIRSYCKCHYSEKEILGVFIQLSQTLAELEEKNTEEAVIHNDLKPDNIIMSDDGHPVLIDFNISKKVSEPLRKIHTQATEGFEAPEKKMNTISIKSDIYSFGCVLKACMDQNPDAKRPDVYSSDLKSIKKKCTEEDPELRFGSFCDVKKALEALKCKREITLETARPKTSRANINLKDFLFKHIQLFTTMLYGIGLFFLTLALYMIFWGPTRPKGYTPSVKEDIAILINDIKNL